MNSQSRQSNSRIYSTARMKRRQNKTRNDPFEQTLTASAMRSSVSKMKDIKGPETPQGTSQESPEELPKEPLRRRNTRFDPNAENIRPGDSSEHSSKSKNVRNIVSSELQIPHRKFTRVDPAGSFDSEDSEKEFWKFSEADKVIQEGQTVGLETQKIKILASLLPDEVLRDPTSTSVSIYETAVMFPDVSGFTQLCQKYDKTGKGGPSRLTAVLNGYIGSMIKIVLSRNGDVLKFGGDAFLCTWKATEELDLTEMVHLAIESAIDIQKHCGEHNTDVGVKLRVKVGVAAGTAKFSNIGTKTRKHYIIVGPPVYDVRIAEGLCKAGDVIVSPSAWKFVKNYMYFTFTYHSDNRHIKVHDFGPLWTRRSTYAGLKSKIGGSGDKRPFLKHIFQLAVEDLRPFILPPVMRSVDLDRPLEYLTEMRQVAIVFFNIDVDTENMSSEKIIALSDKVFQCVSRKVGKAGGGTNKLTLFDKDMAILTVFGLKGFKHALASQVALKCAFSCLEDLQKLDVKSVSAGVTTGMAYCGVIGHAMRKEYTVMGHPVNMAARLMCAYKNIVSCDRNTFLNSKLESGHFEVLQVQYLKGIQNAGPFYKFNIRAKRAKMKVGQEAHPLLGRAKEVEKFGEFLTDALLNDDSEHFLIIYGGARIGKTRLMQKLVNVAHTRLSREFFKEVSFYRECTIQELLLEVEGNLNFKEADLRVLNHFYLKNTFFQKTSEVHVIPLTEDDSKVSFSTIRLIFQPLLGLGEVSTVEEREDKILSRLKNVKELYLLASYNQIFNVNFELSPQYLALNPKEQASKQIHCLQTLYDECFRNSEKWLIVIEDAEFVDEDSWKFLLWCSEESHRALYLLTVGEKKNLSHAATNALEKIKARKIFLAEIDKWFYLGLACQILEVQAMPVELENLLQNYKSSGNPGWLESFLLSLIQSRSIYITSIHTRQMKSLGLVAPPDFMLTSGVGDRRERDNSHWVDCLETFEMNENLKRSKIRVCLLGPEFRKNVENEEDLTMDVMFIKTIDTLEPLEQLVLKAGSVLGNNLMRHALEFIINKEINTEKRQIAKESPGKNLLPTCYQPLCLFIRFQILLAFTPSFLLATHLLSVCLTTINTVSASHILSRIVYSKAIKHLFEIKILTCAKGDLNQKNQVLPKRTILEPSIRKLICECEGLIIPESCADLPKYANCGYMQFCSSTFRETLYNLLLDDQKKSFHNACIEYLRENTYRCKSCNSVRFQNIFGFEENNEVKLACTKTSMHGVKSTKIEQIFNESTTPIHTKKSSWTKENPLRDNEDLIGISEGACECAEILSAVYAELLDHAAGSGRKDLMLEIQLEYASLNLTTCNIPLTMQILEEAMAHVNQMKEDKEYPELYSPFIYSKIYTLMGATKLYIGRLDDAMDNLKKGLHLLKKSFPANAVQAHILSGIETLSLALKTQVFPRYFLKRTKRTKAHYLELLSECFGLISVLYMYKKNFKQAKYAAVWSLNKALESNRNFFTLCTAYTNTIEVFYCQRKLKACAKLEVFAIDVCKKCAVCNIELYEWEAIGRLYKVIFQVRHARAEIEEAVQIGFQSIKIASVLSRMNLKLDLIPDLIFALIQMNRLSEAVSLMQELEYISRLDSDKTSRLWYYSICLDFQLYTGFTVVSYAACEEFIKTADSALIRDPQAKHKLYASLWLWCVRNAEWELIKAHGKNLKPADLFDNTDTPSNVFMRLERLEGLLIILVYKMDSKNLQSVNPIYSEIQLYFQRLEKDIKFIKLMKPRFLLLKSYYRHIRLRDSSAFRLLNQAQVLAEKIKDLNTYQWIVHLKLLWTNAISHIQREYWNEHCRDNVLEWHEWDTESKRSIISYSLPLPRF